MQLPTFMRQLRHDLQLEHELLPDDDGNYRVELAPDFVIGMSPLEEGFMLGCDVGVAREEDYETLLLANLFGQGTGGSTLGIGGEESRRLLCQQGFPYDMTYVEFKEHVERFVNWAEFWKEEVQ